MRTENESNSASDEEQNVAKDTTEISTIENKDSTNTTTTLDQNETKGSILSEPNFTKKTNEGNQRKKQVLVVRFKRYRCLGRQ